MAVGGAQLLETCRLSLVLTDCEVRRLNDDRLRNFENRGARTAK